MARLDNDAIKYAIQNGYIRHGQFDFIFCPNQAVIPHSDSKLIILGNR